MPFKAGHTIAAKLIAGTRTSPGTPMATLLRQVSKDVTGKEIVYTDAQLAELLSPRHFVEVRKTYGGPSPSETARALGVSKEALSADEGWLRETHGRLRAAEDKLKEAAARL